MLKGIILLDPSWPEKKWLKGGTRELVLSFFRSKMWACLVRHSGNIYIVDAHAILGEKVRCNSSLYVSLLVKEYNFPGIREKDGSMNSKKNKRKRGPGSLRAS